jgi:hypothetical protein
VKCVKIRARNGGFEPPAHLTLPPIVRFDVCSSQVEVTPCRFLVKVSYAKHCAN